MEPAMSSHVPSAEPARTDEPFLRLLYRYLWPFACFRDVTRGQRLERQLNYRYNRAMRVHLPRFAFRWAFITCVLTAMGLAFARIAVPELVTAGIFASAVSAFTVSVVAMTAWCWLTRFPELY